MKTKIFTLKKLNESFFIPREDLLVQRCIPFLLSTNMTPSRSVLQPSLESLQERHSCVSQDEARPLSPAPELGCYSSEASTTEGTTQCQSERKMWNMTKVRKMMKV